MHVDCVERCADGTFETRTDSGDVYYSPAVIVTAGGTPIKLGIPGEIEYAGKGVSYCAICDGAFFRKQTIAVVGGGDAATEEADFLTRYADKVYLIHRRDELRASKILQQRLFANPKVEVIWNSVVDEVEADEQGLVNNLRLRDIRPSETSDLAATGCSCSSASGRTRESSTEHVDHDDMGYFKTDANMQTSIRGLFAAGDVRAQLTRQVTTAVGDATTAAIAVEKYLKALRGRRSERADRRHGRLHGVKIDSRRRSASFRRTRIS